MAKRKRPIGDILSTCSRGRKQKKDAPYVPNMIVFNILSWLPAEFLHNQGKYICKAWAGIIGDPLFIKQHLLQSNAELYLQESCKKSYLIRLRGWKTKVLNLNLNFSGIIMASSGGVSLFHEMDVKGERLCVANLVTMQTVKLMFPPSRYVRHSCSIAYISQTGKVKVICSSVDRDGSSCWFVWTVGVDISWRKVDASIPSISPDSYNMFDTRSIDGVFYCFPKGGLRKSDCRIIVIDLHDECIHYVKPPNGVHDLVYRLMETRNKLSCLMAEPKSVEVEVHLLMDFRRSEWVKAFKFVAEDGGGLPIWDRMISFCCWLDDGVLVMAVRKKRKGSMLVAYNVKTRAMKRINIPCFDEIPRPIRHISSLISW